MKKCFKIVVFLVCVLKISSVFSQKQQVEFFQLSNNVSVEPSITYAVKQDSIGNVWIASDEGVLKYNSKKIKTYNSYKGLPKGIGNRIYMIFVDSKQQVWISLERGICVYNPDLDVFELVASKKQNPPIRAVAISEDVVGNIWFGAFNGLWRCPKGNPISKIESIVGNYIIDAVYTYKQKVVFLSKKGLFVYDRRTDDLQVVSVPFLRESEVFTNMIKFKNQFVLGTSLGRLFVSDFRFKEIKKQPVQFSIKDKIKDFEVDKEGNLYIATDGGGIYYVDENFNLLNHFIEDPDTPKSLSSNGVYDIEIGNEDIVWVATYGGGINYFNANPLPFKNIKHQIRNKNSLSTNSVNAISEDTEGNIWFGSKLGVSIWNEQTNTWKHIKTFLGKDVAASDVVMALQSDEDYMWIGTFNHGFFKVNIHTYKVDFSSHNKSKLLQKVFAIYKDTNKNIWLGGIQGDVVVFRENGAIDSYPLNQTKTFSELQNKNILAGGRFGVDEIMDAQKEIRPIEQLKPEKVNRSFTVINALGIFSKDEIVVATNGAGLIFYNIKTKKTTIFNKEHGMPSDVVQGVLVDSSKSIWVSTTNGLAKIKIQKKDTLVNVFNKQDGLASNEFNKGSYAKLKDGRFVFGGRDGVVIFNPLKVHQKTIPPKLVFNSFKVLNKTIKPNSKILKKHINQAKEITLKNNENSIEFNFTGISHSASKIKYSWMLEGFDKDWTPPSLSSFATYTNLNKGDYVFKVKAINKYGQESPVRSIHVKVKTSWWGSWMAFIVYGLLVALVVLLIIYLTRISVERKNADAQIDFFNNVTHEIKTPLAILISTLDGIAENTDTIAGEESKKRIKTTVKRINSLFEQMLNFHKVTAQDEVSQEVSKINLNHHLEKIVAEFYPLLKERKLSVKLINKWKDEFFYHDKSVFNKVVFNLLSNAIKYSSDGGEIILRTATTMQGELKIEVIDEGVGIPKDQQKHILNRYYRARNVINSQRSGTGLGLVMVKKLLEKTGGSISFKSVENQGTIFTVLLKNQIATYKKQETDVEAAVCSSEMELEDLKLEEFSDNKILIVEDNEELRKSLANALAIYFQVYEAENGVEGLQMASQFFPDLILTDLIMPEMDGMQMARKLKEDINLNHIPVFMLTVLQNSAQKLESIEAGIVEYIEKPVDMKMLLAKIANILKWQKKLHKKYIHENETEKATLFRNKSDQEFLQNLQDCIIENIVNNSFSVHDLSENFGMSRTSLYMKLKNLVDLSPQDFIIHTKLKHAKNLLIKGGMSIKEVAYNSGFSNPKYFSTSFKKFYGMTPSAFLDSLKEN